MMRMLCRCLLQGSSFLRLPPALSWVVGNANYHHVHHLSARIPNYRLRAAHEEQPIFAGTPVITIRSSLDTLRLKLWDEERGALVRFPRASVLDYEPAPILPASSTK